MHHINELVSDACCKAEYQEETNATKSPFEKSFQMFKKSWNGHDKSLYFKGNQLKQSRELSSEVSNTIDFLKQ